MTFNFFGKHAYQYIIDSALPYPIESQNIV